MSQKETAHALAQMLRAHRDQLVDALVGQAPAAGSVYAHLGPAALRPRMALVVDACIESIDRREPALLGQFMRLAAEERVREGYSLDSLITLALITEGALSDTAEIAFETEPQRREEARTLIRVLIATAERVLDSMSSASEVSS